MLGNEGFGNPYSVSKFGRIAALYFYEHNILPNIDKNELLLLKTKTLGCWCVEEKSRTIRKKVICHGQLLLDKIKKCA